MVETDVAPLDALLQAVYETPGSFASRLRDAFDSPAAQTFVVDGDDGPVGMATLHDYDTMGYVALVGVAPKLQRRGVGWQLMTAVMAASEQRAHDVLALEASEAGRKLYDALGFQAIGATITLEGSFVPASVNDTRIRRAVPDDCDLLAAYDAAVFGGDRSDTMRRIFARSSQTIFIADDGHHIGGYVAARRGRLGPWVAETPVVAGELLDAAASELAEARVMVAAPEENFSAIALVAKRQFYPRFRNIHMTLGLPLHYPRRSVYGLISLGEG